jgi:hypothetical protein
LVVNDFANRCFICSIEREVFQRVVSERSGVGIHNAGKRVFLDHITYDHRPWDYLFFFEYLKQKNDPMTSNEESVLHHIHEARWLSFFPLGRAKILETEKDGQSELVRDTFFFFFF